MTGAVTAQTRKEGRDAVLAALVAGVPYIRFLGIRFERHGDELTGVLPFRDMLIGNPDLPALHGGVTASFLEVTAIVTLAWEAYRDQAGQGAAGDGPQALPRTIDITTDFLRAGQPRDAYARAEITRSGRRYASVRARAWQDERARPIAEATGHFLMPGPERRR